MGPYACERQNEEGQSGEELFLAEQTNEARKCVIIFRKKQLSLCRFRVEYIVGEGVLQEQEVRLEK